ncbi:MAG: sodium:proton antiporter NhaD [Bacteroidaceae bacterium]|nr:sodium:proton antiporter NhaD [Bacteroidaceae bacterium]
MFFYYLMPVIFLLGIIGIALEDVIKVNKAATAVGMCILLWLVFLLNAEHFFMINPPTHIEEFMAMFPQLAEMPLHELAFEFLELKLVRGLGDVATTLFFVLGSMAIIDIVDSHGGFGIISQSIKTNSQRKLLWALGAITFFMSILLGNLATVIVMVSIARKLVPERNTRLIFSSLIIIAANAGGSCSPIGDVTTLLLWTGGNLSALHQISSLILPSMAMLVVPLAIATFMLPKDAVTAPLSAAPSAQTDVNPATRKAVLWVGLGSLAMVPVLQTLIQLPPFMGVLLGLVLLWVITDRKYADSEEESKQNLRVQRSLARVDISTIFFFLGILMSVQALIVTGQLAIMANFLSDTFADKNHIAIVLGILSSFLDNVALVSATMGMYPLQEAGTFVADSSFWTLLAFCAVTGGSLLIIGSAAGVTVMGMEKISFGYYLKRFSPLVLLGFFAGVLVYMFLC